MAVWTKKHGKNDAKNPFTREKFYGHSRFVWEEGDIQIETPSPQPAKR